ncbi:MAG: glutamine--fructose-6-phosphate transaminase (isomerizing) [Candidatus Omnitrophota bacterium]
MCGIFGYIGKPLSLSVLLDGLSRMEYRGYDSCGIAGIPGSKSRRTFFLSKRAGKINGLRNNYKHNLNDTFTAAILHTRWATHGEPNKINAHPHLDGSRNIAIVHNGIIENYKALKTSLIKSGSVFRSDTDTEVIAQLIGKFYKGELESAVFAAFKQLEGSFALAVISRQNPEKLVGVRKGSPLIVGLSKDGGFLASDIHAILPFSRNVVYLKDREFVVMHAQKTNIFTFERKPVMISAEKITLKQESAQKKNYKHFMLKEIMQQPEILNKIFSYYSKGEQITFPDLNVSEKFLRNLDKIYITACGTAYHAGLVGKYFLEELCGIDVEIDVSSEFRYRQVNIKRGDLLIAVSQSGETADTLAAVRRAKQKGAKVIGMCNVLGSSLVKESQGIINILAGPEIGVASTKAYTAQLMVFYIFALYFGRLRKAINPKIYKSFFKELEKIPIYAKKVLQGRDRIKNISRRFSKFGCFLFLGRGINYPSALEGALKLKEISYIPAEGYPAGEMKHGPIALIDEYRAVVCIAPKDNLYEKMVSNVQEIKARKGKVFGVLTESDKEARFLSDEAVFIPKLINQQLSPIPAAVVLQLFAYYIAINLGCEIDQPRNLAKSVTVE